MYRKNVAGQFFCFQGVDTTTGGIKSGVTWTVRRCIDGTFAAAGGTATEDSTNGWYKFAMTQADTNGNDISFNFTGTGAVPQTVNLLTTAADPSDSVRFGLTALPNAAAGANTGLPVVGTQVPNATAGAANGLHILGTNSGDTSYAGQTGPGMLYTGGTDQPGFRAIGGGTNASGALFNGVGKGHGIGITAGGSGSSRGVLVTGDVEVSGATILTGPVTAADPTNEIVLGATTNEAIATALLDLTDGVEVSVTVRQTLRATGSALAGNVTGTGSLYAALGNSGTGRLSVVNPTADTRTVTPSL